MSHLYPLAISAKAALDAPKHAALSRGEAERLAGEIAVIALETEWLKLPVGEAEALKVAADAGVGEGFVQYYEDAGGMPVLAVTYWKLADVDAVEAVPEPAETSHVTEEDHTDDLYFRSGRTKKRGRKKKVDPNQMDLFGSNKDG